MTGYSEQGQTGPSTASPSTASPSTASPSTAEARASVVDALGRMERGERNSLDLLRDVLCAFVTVLKSRGASRDEAIEAVRSVISEPATSEGAFRLLPPAREALIELSIHWCAEAYGRA